MTAPTYFEFVERKPALDVIPWEDPEEITVVERKLEPDQYEAMLRQYEDMLQPLENMTPVTMVLRLP